MTRPSHDSYSMLSGFQSMHEECSEPVRASVVTTHNIVHAGPHMVVTHADQPGHRVLGHQAGQLAQSGGQVVQTPGTGEVEAIKMNQFAISPVNHLGILNET